MISARSLSVTACAQHVEDLSSHARSLTRLLIRCVLDSSLACLIARLLARSLRTLHSSTPPSLPPP
eukprot:3510073-Pleurochrysis_carterae.AAC.2